MLGDHANSGSTPQEQAALHQLQGWGGKGGQAPPEPWCTCELDEFLDLVRGERERRGGGMRRGVEGSKGIGKEEDEIAPIVDFPSSLLIRVVSSCTCSSFTLTHSQVEDLKATLLSCRAVAESVVTPVSPHSASSAAPAAFSDASSGAYGGDLDAQVLMRVSLF